MLIPFDNSYAALPDGFFTRLAPTAVKAPKLLAFNTDLARIDQLVHQDNQRKGNQDP